MKKSLNILVIDDEVMMTAILKRMLARDGHSSDCYNNLESALKALEEEKKFDLVITDGDIHSPGDGIQMVTAAKAKGIPVLAMSGDHDNGPVMLKAGADKALNKPFFRAELRSALQEIFES